MDSKNIDKESQNGQNKAFHKNNLSTFSVLMIGSEVGIFDEKSQARQNILDYSQLVGQLQIIVFTKRRQGNFLPTQISPSIFVYPTSSLSRWLYIFDALRLVKKIAANKKWLITAQDPFEAGLTGFLIKRKTGAALQLQIHTDFLSPYFGHESFFNLVRVSLAKFLIPRADGIRVVSQRIKNSLKKYNLNLKNEPVVLPILVEAVKIMERRIRQDLRQKYPQFNFIILMASRLAPEKNISLAIEAMVAVIKKYPQTGLIITGDGREKDILKSKIKKLGLEKNIILEPWTEDLTSYQKTVDLFLLTSNYEGYGRTIISALIAGCPVVMTDVGCAGEIIRNNQNGLVVPVGDSAALTSAVMKIIEDDFQREQFKKQGQEIIKELSTKEQYLMEYKKSWEICL